MAFYRGPQSPREDQQQQQQQQQQQHYANAFSPSQSRNPNRWSASMTSNSDVRGSLHRRFTTTTVPSVNGIPSLSPIGQQRLQAAGESQQSTGLHQRYETLLLQQRQIQEELARIDPETRREVDENLRHEQAVTQLIAQSEPSTPPEYKNSFSTYSRSNRYSTASLTSPPGIVTRPNRASTQLTSPSLSFVRTYVSGGNNSSHLPSQSVPGSRRHSDDEDEEEEDYRRQFESGYHRAAAKPNRNSMPITSYDRSKRNTTDLNLGPINTTEYLFGADEEKVTGLPKATNTSPPDTKTYLKVQHTADGFPKLIRSEQTFNLSAVSSALDLASSAEAEQSRTVRNRISLPATTVGGSINSILANSSDPRPSTSNRRSVDVKLPIETKRPAPMATAPRSFIQGSQMPSSFSTNDLPTLKSINGDHSDSAVSLQSPPSQSKGNTNSLEQTNGRGRVQAAINGHGPEFPSLNNTEEAHDIFVPQSVLQGNATPFGPTAMDANSSNRIFAGALSTYGQQGYFNPYAMQMFSTGFQTMNIGASNGYSMQPQFPIMNNGFQAPPTYMAFPQFQQPAPTNASVGRIAAPPRRSTAEEAQISFNAITIKQVVGQIYGLCKDQHGCRFLQRKLDERDDETVRLIFNDVKDHMVELMVDPFGNYLCQKLLESCNDEQRTDLVRNAMPAMTKIALNQHGTRALQKMIEFLSKPEQTALIIEALKDDVVTLIQDLNGNHVIQKCLNHLSSEDAQFIFEAVGNNCVTVGTHRHGCCVLQRCIDHADGLQKGAMVSHVIANANALVKDPFGNYVVQYILDLAEPCFTEPLSRAFLPDIVYLSMQKFSSNVIEKCIRCASVDTRRDIVTAIMAPSALERLVRDSFGNYAVQTAMEYADDEIKPSFVDRLRNTLPTIRNTPHGRRIQSKINDYDNRIANAGSTTLGPLDSVNGVEPPRASQINNRSNRHGMIGAPQQWSASNYAFGQYALSGSTNGGNNQAASDIIAPTPQRSNAPFVTNGPQDYAPNGYGHRAFAGHANQAYGHL